MALCLGLSLPLANAVARGATADVASGACQAFGTVTTLSQAAPAIVCQATRHRLLIVGDEHGSNEIPDFVAQLVKAASANRPVRLGLEIEGFEQQRIQAYLASRGGASDRAALLHDAYWSAGQGRTSKAIVRLIESVRAMRAQGRDVDIFTMLPSAYPGDAAVAKAGGMGPAYNEWLADSIRIQLKDAAPGHGIVIAFMGRAHAALTRPATPSDATAADRLLAESPYLVELAVHGKAWNCSGTDGCGPHAVAGTPAMPADGPILRKLDRSLGAIVRVQLLMPALTPSPPAREKAPKA